MSASRIVGTAALWIVNVLAAAAFVAIGLAKFASPAPPAISSAPMSMQKPSAYPHRSNFAAARGERNPPRPQRHTWSRLRRDSAVECERLESWEL
jgi:hypothetical protein